MQLTIKTLSKSYANGVKAIDGISLTIPTGMFGLLGPNGAGKSTLMRTLATLQEADSGSVQFGHLDVLQQKTEVRKLLGYLPQEFGVYPNTSAVRMLDHIALLKGITPRKERRELVDAMLDQVNLYQHRKKAVSQYSGGMKRRFGIAQALIGQPRLLIVDEPTAGLDPTERNRFYNLLADVGESVVVILSTHIVQDVRELCSNMAIIHNGRLLFAGPPIAAEATLEGRIWRKSISKAELNSYRERHDIISQKRDAGQPLIHILSDNDPGDAFIATAPDLEHVFFSLTRST